MQKQVIAEWVETPEVLKLLQEMGAQFGQGYLFQKPTLLDGSHEHRYLASLSA
jgi:EAL domain-containing protein (putative c-di-GMP-specific phosphodiesterase class I)